MRVKCLCRAIHEGECHKDELLSSTGRLSFFWNLPGTGPDAEELAEIREPWPACCHSPSLDGLGGSPGSLSLGLPLPGWCLDRDWPEQALLRHLPGTGAHLPHPHQALQLRVGGALHHHSTDRVPFGPPGSPVQWEAVAATAPPPALKSAVWVQFPHFLFPTSGGVLAHSHHPVGSQNPFGPMTDNSELETPILDQGDHKRFERLVEPPPHFTDEDTRLGRFPTLSPGHTGD